MTRRRLIGAAVGLAMLVLGVRWVLVGGASTSESEGGFATQAVDRGPIVATVTATGVVNPVATVQVGTYVSGPILALDVDFNSEVKKGQRVAKIDPAPFAVKVRGAEANLSNTRAKVEKSRADLAFRRIVVARLRGLWPKRAVSKNDLDTAESNYAQATAQLALDEAAVKQAEAALEESGVNLRYTDITSPVDGVVVARNVNVGQTVAASFQTPTLFLIAEDLTKMQVDTNVSESDIGRVVEGQSAAFSVDSYPGTSFVGTVAQVRNAPTTVQNVVTYDVVVAVDNTNLQLKPGMTASVTITTARRDDALRIPVRALRFRPPAPAPAGDDASRVFVVESDGKLRRVAVKTGARDAERTEVLEGELREGEQVAVGSVAAWAGPAPPSSPLVGTPRRF